MSSHLAGQLMPVVFCDLDSKSVGAKVQVVVFHQAISVQEAKYIRAY